MMLKLFIIFLLKIQEMSKGPLNGAKTKQISIPSFITSIGDKAFEE